MLIAQRYTLGPLLGRGGMGEVYRATDDVLGRSVAVKVMLRPDSDPLGAERFHREARAAAMLSDPHIVAVYDFGQHDDGFYLVMELVEGKSVAGELADGGPLSWDRAIDIIEQSAAGLAAAHRLDVVHRDIKPSNLLLTSDGTVKVADFGIAHLPGSEAATLTATGQIMGSPHYLSPERARGQRATKASDVYALGCVLYQLVTGRPPFMGDHPTAVLYQHVDTAPIPPSQLRPELAGPYEALVLRMLAKSPADRPSADELAAGAVHIRPLAGDVFPTPSDAPDPEVAAALGSGAAGVGLRADGSSGTEYNLVGPTPTTPAPPVGDRGPFRRKRLLIGALAVVATAGAVTAGVLIGRDGPSLPPTTDVGPRPGVTSGTPARTTTAPTPSGEVTHPNQNSPGRPSPDNSGEATSPSPTASPTTTVPSTAAPTTAPTTPASSAPPQPTTSQSDPPRTTAPETTPPPSSEPTETSTTPDDPTTTSSPPPTGPAGD